MLTRQGATLAVAAALAVGAAACGSSSSSSSGSATAGAGSTAQLQTGGSSTGSAMGGGGFCSEAKGKLQGLQASLAQLATSGDQKEQLKKEVEAWQTYTQSAEADAPSEIKGDVTVIAGFIKHLSDAYAKTGYDPLKAAAVVGPYIQQNQGKLQTASDHIQAWAQANCGL
jgi:hypothetical protein